MVGINNVTVETTTRKFKPSLGGGPHLREDFHRLGLRGLLHRRVQSFHCGLADLYFPTQRPRDRRDRDGDLLAQWTRPLGVDSPLGQGAQYLSISYADRLGEAEIVASVGSKDEVTIMRSLNCSMGSTRPS